jgi:hypothetical protein
MTYTARVLSVAALLALGAAFYTPRAVLADGAASTRNIIFGAAAVGGALLIINHNKQVHQKYADDAARQAQLQAQSNDAQAAYASQKRAYDQEVALVQQYKREVAYQHEVVQQQDRQLAALRAVHSSAFVQPGASQNAGAGSNQPTVVSYGWGSF